MGTPMPTATQTVPRAVSSATKTVTVLLTLVDRNAQNLALPRQIHVWPLDQTMLHALLLMRINLNGTQANVVVPRVNGPLMQRQPAPLTRYVERQLLAAARFGRQRLKEMKTVTQCVLHVDRARGLPMAEMTVQLTRMFLGAQENKPMELRAKSMELRPLMPLAKHAILALQRLQMLQTAFRRQQQL